MRELEIEERPGIFTTVQVDEADAKRLEAAGKVVKAPAKVRTAKNKGAS